MSGAEKPRSGAEEKLKKENEKSGTGKNGLYYPLLGVSMPLCIFLSYLVGHYLDKALGTGPVLLVVFILLGVAAAYVQLFRLIKKD